MVPVLTSASLYGQNGKVSPNVHTLVLAATTLRMMLQPALPSASRIMLWSGSVAGVTVWLHAYLYMKYCKLTDNGE